jgi:hypothetical protein
MGIAPLVCQVVYSSWSFLNHRCQRHPFVASYACPLVAFLQVLIASSTSTTRLYRLQFVKELLRLLVVSLLPSRMLRGEKYINTSIMFLSYRFLFDLFIEIYHFQQE